jgi:hypothetical protein
MADTRERVEYIAPVTTFTAETVTSPAFYDECEWKTYERHETGLEYHYIDDIDFGGEASNVE